jgi:hypothetical protein
LKNKEMAGKERGDVNYANSFFVFISLGIKAGWKAISGETQVAASEIQAAAFLLSLFRFRHSRSPDGTSGAQIRYQQGVYRLFTFSG